MSVYSYVHCSQCNAQIRRVAWNYGKNKPKTMFFCNTTCKSEWQKGQREALGFTKEWLAYEYFALGKSTNEIAQEIGRNPKRVWEWIKEYGMETRPRGTDYGQNFKPGQESAFKGKRHTKENREALKQARLKDGHVPYLKNGRHWLHETGAKPASWKGGVTPERQQFYSTDEWKEAVKHVWCRDNAICQRCGKNHNGSRNEGAFHIHHIVSFSEPKLRAEVNNLILLCKSCHRFIHSKENTKNELIAGVEQ